ncbi:MAG: archaeosortase A, partial [Halobacteria archaeon]|nr:archaeosortase A [Halobacteria archaeon]
VLTLAALPLSGYVAYLIMSEEYDVLVKVSQAVAAMGLIYLPFAFFQPLNNALIEHTAAMEYRVLNLLNVPVELTERDGLQRMLVVTNPATGEVYKTYIILACTGIGSMSIFGGIIAAVRAPLRQKMKALAVAIPVIYVLNLARTVFISMAY